MLAVATEREQVRRKSLSNEIKQKLSIFMS